MSEQAHVLYCVKFDAQTHECVTQAWLPAPSLLPPLSVKQAGQILPMVYLLFAVAWGWKKLGQHIEKH